jgi:hypothetical protein
MKTIVVNKIKSPIRGRKGDGVKNERLEKIEADNFKLREKLSISTKIIENYKKQIKKKPQKTEEIKLQKCSMEEEGIINLFRE